MSSEAYLQAVGSEAYVQFPHLITYSAINEGYVCTGESFMEGIWCV